MVLFISGCIEPYPPSGQVTPPPTTIREIPMATPTIKTEPTTIMVGRGIEAVASESGYIERSYGYTLYISPPDFRLTYIEATATKDSSGMVTISGKIKNEGPGNLNYLQLIYTLFDSNGNVLGNAHASVEYLSAGKTWKFATEPVKADQYQYFELARVMVQ